jgi:hypothetical protein
MVRGGWPDSNRLTLKEISLCALSVSIGVNQKTQLAIHQLSLAGAASPRRFLVFSYATPAAFLL